jgi:hypothetical protein
MPSPKKEYFTPSHPEHPMSAAAATELVRKMIHNESRTSGDAENAMRVLSRRYGIGFWTLDHLRKGRAKTCDSTLLGRIRSAYVDLCERQLRYLESEIATEKAAGDDTLADLELEVSALAQKIQEAKRSCR